MTLRCSLLATALLVAAAGGAGGCHEPAGPRAINNPDPAVKIPAIKRAVAGEDLQQAAAMIKSLQSDDPAVRMFAIQGLHRLTGEDFGYAYYADAEERRSAVAQWERWLAEQRGQ